MTVLKLDSRLINQMISVCNLPINKNISHLFHLLMQLNGKGEYNILLKSIGEEGVKSFNYYS